jgi:hypothetical protein
MSSNPLENEVIEISSGSGEEEDGTATSEASGSSDEDISFSGLGDDLRVGAPSTCATR